LNARGPPTAHQQETWQQRPQPPGCAQQSVQEVVQLLGFSSATDGGACISTGDITGCIAGAMARTAAAWPLRARLGGG
jgi:hypothetical protein